MRHLFLLPLLLGSLVACAPLRDPRVQAAEQFRDTAFALIDKDEAQMRKLNGLRLGMTDEEVITSAGPPSHRESRSLDDGELRETWSYQGELKSLATLTFEARRLVQIITD